MGTDPGIGRSGSCRGCQLVEDNELNREIAQFILEHTGITVVNAENGKEALLAEVVDEDEPDEALTEATKETATTAQKTEAAAKKAQEKKH